jgi:hypothetical protein
MNLNNPVTKGSSMVSSELEKSIDTIILSWISKGYYTDMTEGQIRKVLSDILEPMIEDIKMLENDILDNQSFGVADNDELMMKLSRKKMSYIRKISELSKTR